MNASSLRQLFASTHERAALAFADLASALDAGLSPAQLGARDLSSAEAAVLQLLADRGVQPSAAEVAMLGAAAQAGRLPQALRQRAAARQQGAEFRRDLWRGLRYPLFLIGMATVMAATVGRMFGGSAVLWWLLAGIALLTALIWAGRRSLRGEPTPLPVPGMQELGRQLAEIPFLEALQGLYASGVPLLAAHSQAVAAVPSEARRLPFFGADRLLQEGRPLAEAHAGAGALHTESLQLLHAGEVAGNLEDALQRALTRRRDVVARRATSLCRGLGHGMYLTAIVVVIYVLFSFYGGYYGRFR